MRRKTVLKAAAVAAAAAGCCVAVCKAGYQAQDWFGWRREAAKAGDPEILASIGMTIDDVDEIANACEAGDYGIWDTSKVSYGSPLEADSVDVHGSGCTASCVARRGICPPTCFARARFPMPELGCLPRGMVNEYTVTDRTLELLWYDATAAQIDAYLDELDCLGWQVGEALDGWYVCKAPCEAFAGAPASFEVCRYPDGDAPVEVIVPASFFPDRSCDSTSWGPR